MAVTAGCLGPIESSAYLLTIVMHEPLNSTSTWCVTKIQQYDRNDQQIKEGRSKLELSSTVQPTFSDNHYGVYDMMP